MRTPSLYGGGSSEITKLNKCRALVWLAAYIIIEKQYFKYQTENLNVKKWTHDIQFSVLRRKLHETHTDSTHAFRPFCTQEPWWILYYPRSRPDNSRQIKLIKKYIYNLKLTLKISGWQWQMAETTTTRLLINMKRWNQAANDTERSTFWVCLTYLTKTTSRSFSNLLLKRIKPVWLTW